MCAEVCVKVRIKGREEVLSLQEALSLFECLQRELEKAKTELASVEFKRPMILVEAKRALKKAAISRHEPTLEASRRKTILELLDKKEAHIKEIADAVGLAKSTAVFAILNRLIKDGVVARVRRGVYAKARQIEAEKRPAPKPAVEPQAPAPQPTIPQPTALKPQPAGPPSPAPSPPLEKRPEARPSKLPPEIEEELFSVPEEVKKLLEKKMRERV